MSRTSRNILIILICILLGTVYWVISAGMFFYFIRNDPRLSVSYDHIPGKVIGFTLKEVEAKYGESTEYSEELFRRWDKVYYLGPDTCLFSVDSSWLIIRLDDDSKVTEARVACD